jgi:hypothetical protein
MISDTRKYKIGAWGPVAVSAMSVILVAAASEQDANWERLRSMPPEQRARLLDNLQKFDLVLTPEQRSAVREIDRRLSLLSPGERAQYMAVLGRYHAWLNGLPEMRQDELTAKPPNERMALVRKWIVDRPVPFSETPKILRMIEPGEFNVFEIASAYLIWQALDADLRSEVEKKTPERVRREFLFRVGARPKFGVPRETKPADFDEEHWIGQIKGTPAIVQLEDVAKKKVNEVAKKKAEERLAEILRRNAINLYASRADVRPVDAERLARFVAGLPGWISSSFDHLPPDEARRRMTVAYRLVFPGTAEIGASKKTAATATKGQSAPTKKPSAPAKAKRKNAGTEENSAPF